MTSQGESVFFTTTDGLNLHAVDYGRGVSDDLPVVCLPGLSRNARDFARLADHLAIRSQRRRRVVCFDYRGRGLSQWDRDWKNYNILREAEDVLADAEPWEGFETKLVLWSWAIAAVVLIIGLFLVPTSIIH